LDRYQSAEFHYIGIDEVTEFSESDFMFMWSRLRNPPAGVPLRMRSASNPNGVGRLWVKKKYVDATTREDRVFVPSFIDDNEYLREDAAYKENLAKLNTVRREQLLHGNWEIQATGKFQRHWFKILDVIPIDRVTWVRYWDLAATEPKGDADPDWTVGALMGHFGREYFIADIQRHRLTPHKVEQLVLQTAKTDRQTYGHVRIRMEQEPGSSGVKVIADYLALLAGYDFKGDKVTGPKEIRANFLASQAEGGNVYMLAAHWNKDALDEFDVFPGGGHDDIVDACTGAFNELTGVPPINTKQIIMVGERLRPDW
jgi:predicted phage terminase large subunit-like protein